MAKINFSDSGGFDQNSSGTGVQFDSAVTFASSVTTTASPTALTAASTTVSVAGVYTLSGSSAREVVLPLASSVPGSTLVFRGVSAHAHVITGSQEAAGTKVIAGVPGTSGLAGQGSKIALPAVAGSSVALISDGLNFLVTAASGSYTISGT